MKIITFQSLKGGVGKTAICVNLANMFREYGRVLVCDFDPQSSATDYYLRDTDFKVLDNANAYHVLTEQKAAYECVHKSATVDVMPATLNLHKAGAEMQSDPGALLRLRSQFETLDYDFILVDSQPSRTYEFLAALYLGRDDDLVICPTSFDRWAVQGISLLSLELDKKTKATGSKKNIMVVPSMVTEKEAEELRGLDFPVSNWFIRKAATVRTAVNKGLPLKEMTPVYQDFQNLAKEIYGKSDKQKRSIITR